MTRDVATVPLRVVLYGLALGFAGLAVKALLMGHEVVSVGCAAATLLMGGVALVERRRAR